VNLYVHIRSYKTGFDLISAEFYHVLIYSIEIRLIWSRRLCNSDFLAG